MPDTAPNQDQAANWNNASGKTWVEMQSVLDGMLAPYEEIVVDAGFPGEGGRVLDIGCGAGAITLAMARRVGPAGHCVGLDISRPLVAAARARAAREGLGNASFVEGDAQTQVLDRDDFDALISRFGVMFFDDPVAAFANIRRAARTGGRLAFVAWRSPAENDFLTAAVRAAAPLLPDLPTPQPGAPGQFAFADGERVRSILEGGGWSAVELKPVDLACEVAEPDLMAYVTGLGPVGLALPHADAVTARKVENVLRQAFARFVETGVARFTTACWLATARA